MIKAKFARFKFKDFSSTFKHLICFQALSRALKFLFRIQGFLKHAMDPWEKEGRKGVPGRSIALL